MKRDWTDKVRDKLSESAVTPPDGLWTGISSELDAAIEVHSKRVHISVWRWIAAAACLLTIVTCGLQYFISERVGSDFATEKLADIGYSTVAGEVKTLALSQDKPITNNVSTSNNNGNRSTCIPSGSNVMVSQINDKNQFEALSHDNSALLVQPSVPNSADETADSVYTTALTDTIANTAHQIDQIRHLTDYSPVYNNGHKPNNRLSVSLYASNTNMPNLDSGIYGINSGSIIGSDQIYDSMGNSSGGVQNPESIGYELKDVNHRQPIRVGVSVRMPMSSILSISTGVVYTHLTSTLTWTNQKALTFESKQRLNYIGVPVSIDYTLPSYKSAGFYITGGAMVEKCIYGEANLVNSPVTERVSEKAFQTSLFLGAGAEFSLARHLSIYAEPLATFYIDNHSDVKNIYKDRQINLDLRVGLRYTLK